MKLHAIQTFCLFFQTDEHGVALGLVYSSAESIKESIKTRKGVYQSRSRGLWRKGETSGCTQVSVAWLNYLIYTYIFHDYVFTNVIHHYV